MEILSLQYRSRPLRSIPGPDHFVSIPNGRYVAEFIGSEGFFFLGKRPKVVLWFRICDGEHCGERLAAYYNVKSLQCRPGERIEQPSFSVGWRAELSTVLGTLFPDKYSPADLPTVVPESAMQGGEILIQVRKSEKTTKGQKRPKAFHNSVIDSILGWARDF